MNECLNLQGLTLYDSLIKAYIGAVSGNTTAVRIITLNSAPTSSTTTYTIDNNVYNFKVGDEVRVPNLENVSEGSNGYVYYKLYDLETDNNTTTAYWVNASSKPSYSYSEISNTPSSLPASDVYSWAKAENKPSYSYSEVGAAAASHTHIMSEVASMSVVAISVNTSSSCSIIGVGNSGKAETIIYANSGSSDLTVTVPTTYATPDGEAIELTCHGGGYCEVNYININGTIYARGV